MGSIFLRIKNDNNSNNNNNNNNNNMNFNIRKANINDINEIIKLCAEHAEYEKADYSSEGKSEKLASFLFSDNPRLYCLIAEIENEIVGYATYMFEFSTWDAEFYTHMDCLFLRSNARGNGIGEALVNEIKKYSTESNVSLIQWQTPVFNERAIKFYYRIGATSKEKLRMYLIDFQI
jgi:ribosomal protein S18 acetylase RimI-like enzyme